MLKKKIIFVFMLFIIISNVNAFKLNSSNFILFPTIVSGGGEITNSSNFKNYITTDIVAGVINSSNFRNLLGFFYTWLLADGQPCTANNQCQGGFCCSNLCQSSSCPVEGPAVGGGAAPAGGGGGAGLNITDFSLSKKTIKTNLVLAEEKSETFTISNTGDTDLDFTLSSEGEVNEFLSLSDYSFSIYPEESKTISLDFIGIRVGIFIGEIIVKADVIEKSVAISLEIESDITLFDVKLDIPKEFKEVHAGEDLRTQITLLNVGAPNLVDVIATYLIKDLKGNIVYQASETFAVEGQKSFVKNYPIPKNLEAGNYVVIIEIRYENSFAVSSEFFQVVEPGLKLLKYVTITKLTAILFILTLIILSLSVFYLISKKKLFKKS